MDSLSPFSPSDFLSASYEGSEQTWDQNHFLIPDSNSEHPERSFNSAALDHYPTPQPLMDGHRFGPIRASSQLTPSIDPAPSSLLGSPFVLLEEEEERTPLPPVFSFGDPGYGNHNQSISTYALPIQAVATPIFLRIESPRRRILRPIQPYPTPFPGPGLDNHDQAIPTFPIPQSIRASYLPSLLECPVEDTLSAAQPLSQHMSWAVPSQSLSGSTRVISHNPVTTEKRRFTKTVVAIIARYSCFAMLFRGKLKQLSSNEPATKPDWMETRTWESLQTKEQQDNLCTINVVNGALVAQVDPLFDSWVHHQVARPNSSKPINTSSLFNYWNVCKKTGFTISHATLVDGRSARIVGVSETIEPVFQAAMDDYRKILSTYDPSNPKKTQLELADFFDSLRSGMQVIC